MINDLEHEKELLERLFKGAPLPDLPSPDERKRALAERIFGKEKRQQAELTGLVKKLISELEKTA